MKRKFILNPGAGGGLSDLRIAPIRRYFLDKTGSFDCVVGTSRSDLIEKTRQALLEGADQIIPLGGDGTLNAVVNGFFVDGKNIRPATKLVVARLGSGCDYYKSVTRQAQKVKWEETVLNHVAWPVDIGKIEFDRSHDVRYFINMAGIGMSAAIVVEKERLPRWVPKKLCYLVPTLHQFSAYQPKPVKIITDDGSFETSLLAAFAAKGVYAGGGMKFGGRVSLDDGFLDITVFEKMSPLEMILKLGKLYSGAYNDASGIRKIKSRKLRVESPSPILVEFDGEAEGTTGLSVSLVEKAIQVCFPSDSY